MEWQNDRGSTPKKGKFKSYQTVVQRKLQGMHDKWLEKRDEKIQGFADSDNSKQFFNAFKMVYGPSKSSSGPLLSADGTSSSRARLLQLTLLYLTRSANY